LPKIEAKLIELCQDFEKDYKRPFTVFGVPVQDIIEKDYDKKRQEKLTKSGKKIMATPLKTPSRGNVTGLRTPLTVEQTIINRTNVLKSSNRLQVPNSGLRPKVLSTTASSTSSVRSIRTENGKRKVQCPVTSAQPAKRRLLGAFVSPSTRNVLKPSNNNTQNNASRGNNKSTCLKVYNVGSVIKRRSKSRKSIGKKRKSSIAQKCKEIPEIVLSSADELNSDTTSYEGFEVSNDYILTVLF